jgi:hypothetical protein
VEPAERGDHVVAGAEVQVVGVAEDDLGADRAQFVRVEALDGAFRADGHEGGGSHVAVPGPEHAGTGCAVGGDDLEVAHAAERTSRRQRS